MRNLSCISAQEFQLQLDIRQHLLEDGARRAQRTIEDNLTEFCHLLDRRYRVVCEREAGWAKELQVALVVCSDFHQTIQDLQTWLDSMHAELNNIERVESTATDETSICNKYIKLQASISLL